MQATQWLRRLLRRFGIDVVRYRSQPRRTPGAHPRQVLRECVVGCTVYVGANGWQYGKGLRALGNDVPILPFEAASVPFKQLATRAAADGAWHAVSMALGTEDGAATPTVTASSVLASPRRRRPDTHAGCSRSPRELVELIGNWLHTVNGAGSRRDHGPGKEQFAHGLLAKNN